MPVVAVLEDVHGDIVVIDTHSRRVDASKAIVTALVILRVLTFPRAEGRNVRGKGVSPRLCSGDASRLQTRLDQRDACEIYQKNIILLYQTGP